jgi:hypothetical protein
MPTQTIGIVMNGVTGRMGTNQHLARSVCAIIAQGGVRAADGTVIMPRPILTGRNADKLAALAAEHGLAPVRPSTAKSPPPCTPPKPFASRACASRPGSRTASCRTSSSCPGSASSACCVTRASSASILSVRGEFGYWVFTGHDRDQPAQRPSWNYRREDGGGIILDMFCHWRYLSSTTCSAR